MSCRIDQIFSRLGAENRAAFIPYIMAGDPDLEASQKLLNALPYWGADLVELGLPFSDPMADGSIIQAAANRSLASGTALADVFLLARKFRDVHPDVPLIGMGYMNLVEHYGLEKFVQESSEAGFDGMIIVDLPPEEAAGLATALEGKRMDFIRLFTPTTNAQRAQKISAQASGFLYYVSVTGVTGSGSGTAAQVSEKLNAIRKETDLPIAVGFGVKTTQQAQSMAKLADAVVVGSAIIEHMTGEEAEAKNGLNPALENFIRSLSGAVHGARREDL